MKLKKPSEKLIQELTELRDTRKSIDDFLFNYLENFHKNAKLVHHILKDKSTLDIKHTASQQYFVFLVSSIETFFRDIFIYINSVDSNIFLKTVGESNINISTNKITIEELLSKSFNFQNINSIDEAFHNLWEEKFLLKICATEISPCGVNGTIFHHISIAELFPDWFDIINETIEIRHRVVHDANYRVPSIMKLIQKSETLFLFIAQITTYLIAKKYSLASIVLKSTAEHESPYLFSIHDVLAEDWHIVS